SASYIAGSQVPSVVACDVTTSDVYYSGTLLSEVFANMSTLLTNGSAVYCMTVQEDNASLEALLCGAIHQCVDFSRVIVMRMASDFDRPYPGEAASENLFWADQGGFKPTVKNIYEAGIKVAQGVLEGWEEMFCDGITLTNYIGDIFGTLGGTPDFGLYTGGESISKRALKARGVAELVDAHI
ncbi:purine nucleoside permease-domain-containing protein, partial [Fomitopsis betulina]